MTVKERITVMTGDTVYGFIKNRLVRQSIDLSMEIKEDMDISLVRKWEEFLRSI